MDTHEERLATARDAIGYICSRSAEEMTAAVPNCPGWTVYNAAVHIARVGVAWHSMITASPDDADSRARGYADAESRGSGHTPEVLASWALAAIDALEDDVEQPCYFSMTGGSGTVGLWAWHAASELGVHRLDVEDALGEPHAIEDHLAADAIEYTSRYFLPAMTRATGTSPGALEVVAKRDEAVVATTSLLSDRNEPGPSATVTGTPVDILLALWGRPHSPIEVDGSREVFERWHALPATTFQFGTWD